jgi:hypothetical protein
VDVIFRGIDIGLTWKNVEAWAMKNTFFKAIALTTVVYAKSRTLFNIHTISHTGTLTTCENL